MHTVQSGLPTFVPSEVYHLNGGAATELPQSSSGSPSERRLSCVAPSPTHLLLGGDKASEASRPTQTERAVHMVQSELPVFVPSETYHLSGGAATELQPSSSGSPSERCLSSTAPSSPHLLFRGSKSSEVFKPTQTERAAPQAVEA